MSAEPNNQAKPSVTNPLLGFDLKTLQLPLAQLLPSKQVSDAAREGRKYQQILSSIREVGLIEPLSIIQPDPGAPVFLLLDGHMRAMALKDLAVDTAPCLLAHDDESYTYNHRINRLSTIQEHYMLKRALAMGVSKERLARAFNLKPGALDRRISLLEGVCASAIALLQDVQFAPEVTKVLRSMKAARQVESVELMLASKTISVAHAQALLKATPPEQRNDLRHHKKVKEAPLEQIVKLEKEMRQVQTQYKAAEANYGADLLNLVMARAYLTKLLGNTAVKSFMARNEPGIQEHFERLVNADLIEAHPHTPPSREQS